MLSWLASARNQEILSINSLLLPIPPESAMSENAAENDSQANHSPLSDATTEPWTWALEGSQNSMGNSPDIVRTPAVRRVGSSPPPLERPSRKARVDHECLPSLAEVLSRHRSTAVTVTAVHNVDDSDDAGADTDDEMLHTPPVRRQRTTPPATVRPSHRPSNRVAGASPVTPPLLSSRGQLGSQHRGNVSQELPQQAVQHIGQSMTGVHRDFSSLVPNGVYETSEVAAVSGHTVGSHESVEHEEAEDAFENPQKSVAVSRMIQGLKP